MLVMLSASSLSLISASALTVFTNLEFRFTGDFDCSSVHGSYFCVVSSQ